MVRSNEELNSEKPCLDYYLDLFNKSHQGKNEINFWRNEYRKRRFREHFSDDFVKTKQFWDDVCLAVEQLLEKYPNDKTMLNADYMESAYKCSWMQLWGDTGTPLYNNGRDVRDLFQMGNFPDEVKDKFVFLHDQSMFHDYYPWDLLTLQDMTGIFKLINSDQPLPPPPPFHINYGAKKALPEHVLTFLALNPDRKNKKVSLSEELWHECNRQQGTEYSHGTITKVAGITRCPDFIIMAQLLSKDFDLEIVIKEIKFELAMAIFQLKKRGRMELTPYEYKAMIEAYEMETRGEYGPTYSYARAAGLWMWDYYKNGKQSAGGKKTKADAIKALRASQLCLMYHNSDDRTLYRKISEAEGCIKEGEVLSVES